MTVIFTYYSYKYFFVTLKIGRYLRKLFLWSQRFCIKGQFDCFSLQGNSTLHDYSGIHIYQIFIICPLYLFIQAYSFIRNGRVSQKGKEKGNCVYSNKRKNGKLDFIYVLPCTQWQMLRQKKFQENDQHTDFLAWP